MDTNLLIQLFENWCGHEPQSIKALPLSGSDRRYFRMNTNDISVLGVYNPCVEENEAYISFTQHFYQYNILVPKIEMVADNKLYYLVQDIGNDSLYNRIVDCKGELTPEVIELFKKALKHLITMQVSAGETIDYKYSYPINKFNKDAIQWDLNYFKYNFLKLSGESFNETLLEKDFGNLKNFLLKTPMKYFMFRDFQSRNILIKDGEPCFIDFQGGRKGPLAYDVASLLYQAKANIPESTRKELFDYYYAELSKLISVNYADLYNSFKAFAVLRTLQVLGAYGFRGFFEKKPHFLESIPFAIKNLKNLILSEKFPVHIPHICKIAENLIIPIPNSIKEKKILTMRVTSFSYRKGIPADPSSNGGGFVFDCRGIHNPGRYDEYKQLTGKDKEVIQFFNEKTNINEFSKQTIDMVEPTIKSYLERGFNHLMVSFGCTGGQHRSVYCAEKFAAFIRNNFNVHLVLWHREQGELLEYGKEM